jgi:transcriptional regulator with XRE-family HTH domain
MTTVEQNRQALMKVFGPALKALRKKKGITQQALANRLGVHRNAISGWECGNYLPATRGLVVEIARQLECSERYLFRRAMQLQDGEQIC